MKKIILFCICSMLLNSLVVQRKPAGNKIKTDWAKKIVEITEWTKNYGPSRLVNSTSGGNHFQTGAILDLHNYPDPEFYLYDANRVTVLGEYGGIGLPLEGHLWKPDNNWGYIKFKNSKETTAEYTQLRPSSQKDGQDRFLAAIYTQTTDVEDEQNGFMT